MDYVEVLLGGGEGQARGEAQLFSLTCSCISVWKEPWAEREGSSVPRALDKLLSLQRLFPGGGSQPRLQLRPHD